MKKVKNSSCILLSFILLTSCVDNVKPLENRVGEIKEELNEVKKELRELQDKINSNTEFEKEMQCQEMLDRLKKRWNNIIGCYYSSYENTCMVKYKVNGETKESRIEDMSDSN